MILPEKHNNGWVQEKRKKEKITEAARQVEKRPEMLDRIRMEGHAVGWHSRSHLNSWKSGPISGFRDVREMPDHLIDGDPKVRIFRPPYGKATFLGFPKPPRGTPSIRNKFEICSRRV